MKATVLIRPKEGILDPQGEAVGDALRTLGFAVSGARVGRLVRASVGGKRVDFAVALDAAAKRALRRRGKLTLTVKITVTPETGAPYSVTRTVTLHQA